MTRNEQLAGKIFNDYKEAVNSAVKWENCLNYQEAIICYQHAIEISAQIFRLKLANAKAVEQKNLQIQQRINELNSFISQNPPQTVNNNNNNNQQIQPNSNPETVNQQVYYQYPNSQYQKQEKQQLQQQQQYCYPNTQAYQQQQNYQIPQNNPQNQQADFQQQQQPVNFQVSQKKPANQIRNPPKSVGGQIKAQKPADENQDEKTSSSRYRSHSPQPSSSELQLGPKKKGNLPDSRRIKRQGNSSSDYECDNALLRGPETNAGNDTVKNLDKKLITKKKAKKLKKSSSAIKESNEYVKHYSYSDSDQDNDHDDEYQEPAPKQTRKTIRKSRSAKPKTQLTEAKSQPIDNKSYIRSFQPPLLSNIVVQNDMFEYVRQIGAGSFGAVYLVKDKNDGKTYALKEINSPIVSRITEQQLLREIELMNIARHPLVCHLRGFSLVSQSCKGRPPFIVTDYYPNGSLSLVSEGKIKFNPTQKQIVLYGIANAMCYLHSLDIVHRDLKSDNVLLNDLLYPIVCDFGLSKLMEERSLRQTTAAGSPAYMAPELMKRLPYTNSIDVYAYAFICYEVLTETVPFNDIYDVLTLVNMVCSNVRPPIDSYDADVVPKNFKVMIKRAWSDDPAKRPSFNKILTWYQKEKLKIPGVDWPAFLSFVDYLPKY